jgi:hypothetical protein
MESGGGYQEEIVRDNSASALKHENKGIEQ